MCHTESMQELLCLLGWKECIQVCMYLVKLYSFFLIHKSNFSFKQTFQPLYLCVTMNDMVSSHGVKMILREREDCSFIPKRCNQITWAASIRSTQCNADWAIPLTSVKQRTNFATSTVAVGPVSSRCGMDHCFLFPGTVTMQSVWVSFYSSSIYSTCTRHVAATWLACTAAARA